MGLQSGQSIGHLYLPHTVWIRKCEGGERLARAQRGSLMEGDQGGGGHL